MRSKNCVCGQNVVHGDRYCIACGRLINWGVTSPSKEALRILNKKDKK